MESQKQITIPFNKPYVAGNELEYVADAIRRLQTAGDGHFTKLCHQLIESETGCSRALLTTSCTHALEMAAMLLDIQPGDEVIVPAFTFVSTANAFALRGATPVFCDIKSGTWNLDAIHLQRLITKKTRAVVPVHYAGVACEMDAIASIADRHGIALVEDNAHGLFGRYRGRPLGTFGRLATQSFHETKNFSCGEGGALLINDATLIDRAEIIRDKGTNRSRFFRGLVDKYTWVDFGSNYLMGELLAAYLFGQLERRQEIQNRRRVIWETYHCELRRWAQEHGVQTPVVPEECDQSYHMYYIVLPSPELRTLLISHLLRNVIHAVFHYVPLHLSPMGRRFGGTRGACPVAEDVSDRLLRLPFYTGMTEAEVIRVVSAISEFDHGQ